MKWQATCPGCSATVELRTQLAESVSCACGEYDLDVIQTSVVIPKSGVMIAPQARWVSVDGVPVPATLTEVS